MRLNNISNQDITFLMLATIAAESQQLEIKSASRLG
jgi:hypothetical protein